MSEGSGGRRLAVTAIAIAIALALSVAVEGDWRRSLLFPAGVVAAMSWLGCLRDRRSR